MVLNTDCVFMLTVATKSFMPSVVILNAIMMSVGRPLKWSSLQKFINLFQFLMGLAP
jgi:hypothetical protein